jgi:type III restriction enzyme
LVAKSIKALDSHLRVTPLQYRVQTGEQIAAVTDEQLARGESFTETGSSTERGTAVHSDVAYDLIGGIAEDAQLTRRTVAEILTGIEKVTFGQFVQNPEHFIAEAVRLIKEQKAAAIIEKLQYDAVEDRYETDIFTAAQTGQDFSRATAKLKNHVYDYCVVDPRPSAALLVSWIRATRLSSTPSFRVAFDSTPVGDYNPDWAISFKRGSVKCVYFVAETKGSMASLQLRGLEETKIKCARKFFDELNQSIATDKVRYDVVTDYEKLMDLVQH